MRSTEDLREELEEDARLTRSGALYRADVSAFDICGRGVLDVAGHELPLIARGVGVADRGNEDGCTTPAEPEDLKIESRVRLRRVFV